MKTVFQNLKKTDWLLATVCLAFIALQVWLDLKTPDYMAEITTLVQTAGSTMGEILSAGGMMLLCSLGSLAASVVTAICAARIAATLGATLRGRLFSQVQSFSMEESGRFSPASPLHQRRDPDPDAHRPGPANAAAGPHHGGVRHL